MTLIRIERQPGDTPGNQGTRPSLPGGKEGRVPWLPGVSPGCRLNTTFWGVNPLLLLVQEGNVEGFRETFGIRLEAFPAAGRISDNMRKQYEYLTVSLVNTFMIAAILGGAYPPEANWIADRALHRLSILDELDRIVPIVYDAGVPQTDRTHPAPVPRRKPQVSHPKNA